jgi:hypothetical protein
MIRFLPLSFFRWCMSTPIAQVVKQSKWGFAILETFHIIGFTILLGAILVTNLAVLGLGMRQPAERIAKEITRWGLAGLAIVLLSGVPMFMSAATTYSTSFPFLIKMTLLATSLVLQLALTRFPGMYNGSLAGKIAACISLVCWMGIAYAGRAIAFEVLFGTAD